MIKQQKMIKKAGLAVMTTMTVFSLVACGNGTKGTTEEKPAEEVKSEVVAKEDKEKLASVNSFSNPEVAALSFMDIVFGDKTSRIKELTHMSPEQFEEMELDLFRANGELHIPKDFFIEADGSTYYPDEILENYAQTMVQMYRDVTDYNVVKSKETDTGAEVTVAVRGLSGKGLAKAAREYGERYLGPEGYQYKSTNNKELNAVMTLIDFFCLTGYYDHGGAALIVNEPVEFTLFFEKDKHGDYAPAEETLKELYKGAYATDDYQDNSKGKSTDTPTEQGDADDL